MYGRIFNFSAGPGVLPLPVLERARDEMLNCDGSGMSVLEMSHRSKPFEKILARAVEGVRKNLAVPDDYAILFLQGGASLQFSMIPMNLYMEGHPVDMINTGAWTKKAISELKKQTPYRLAGSGEADKFARLPKIEALDLSAEASYVYLCSNNTIEGTQWAQFPHTGDVPLVADMSSDIFSRPVDVSRFGLIFAGAQKNMGPAGVTLVIIRKDLAARAADSLPTMLNYRTFIAENSLYNTPPTFGIYITALTMEWIESLGGMNAIEKLNQEKADLLYGAIDSTPFYYCPVEPQDRSKMNVIIKVRGDDGSLEKKFAEEATAAGLSDLKGHRSVGGLRASIYNAQSKEGVEALVSFMKAFEEKYG